MNLNVLFEDVVPSTDKREYDPDGFLIDMAKPSIDKQTYNCDCSVDFDGHNKSEAMFVIDIDCEVGAYIAIGNMNVGLDLGFTALYGLHLYLNQLFGFGNLKSWTTEEIAEALYVRNKLYKDYREQTESYDISLLDGKQLKLVSISYKTAPSSASIHEDIIFQLCAIDEHGNKRYKLLRWDGVTLGLSQPIDTDKLLSYIAEFKKDLLSLVTDDLGFIDKLFEDFVDDFQQGYFLKAKDNSTNIKEVIYEEDCQPME